MENLYGIGTTNRYSLFLETETDPLETLKIREQEKELKRKTKVVEKENKVKPEASAKGKPAQPPKKIIKDVPHKAQDNKREDGKLNHQRSTDNKPERTYNKFNNENREERNNRRNREDKPFNGNFENNREDRPRREGDFDNRRGRAVAGKPVGRGGIAHRRGKREFERQSGSDKTGVKPVDKREGGGAHNWGSHKDVIEGEAAEATKPTETEQVWSENEKADTSNNSEQKETENETENVPVEEEPKELTLDEWKAQRAGRQKPTYNLRKAGEGEDLTQWKKMYELSKKKVGEEEDSDDDEYDTSEYPQRVGRQKRVVGIDFHFSDSRRGGAGRGRGARAGRGARNNREGGGRGQAGAAASAGGGSGGPTGERPVQGGGNRYRPEETGDVNKVDAKHAPKVDDERDFPSLG